jgi:Tfp pilus assembly protein PilN
MPQQINLCTPILLTQKRYFSAQAMLQALAVFVVFGGSLCAYWVWSLNVASDGFNNALATQTRELASLQSAIAQGKADAAPNDANLAKDLQSRRTELVQREKLLQELQRGLFKPGAGHAARLELLAQTIPAPVWVIEVKADDTQLEVSGFTLEPAALSDWVAKLGASPLLEGQKLTTVMVENTSIAATKAVIGTPAVALPVTSYGLPVVSYGMQVASSALAAASRALPAASSVPPAAPHAMWSFHLVSAIPQVVGVVGGKP